MKKKEKEIQMLYPLFHGVCGTETSIHEIIVVVNTQNRDILPLL